MREIWVVTRKELLDQVRDRRSMVMVLVPILLIPLACLVITFQGVGNDDPRTSVYLDAESYRAYGIDVGVMRAALTTPTLQLVDSAQPYDDLANGKVATIIRLGPDGRTALIQNPMSIASARAVATVENHLQQVRLDDYPDTLGRAQTSNPDAAVLEVAVQDLSMYLPSAANAPLAMIAPTLLVAIILLEGGGIAADIIAGEKERGTLESLLSTQVSRLGLLMGKYLAITVWGLFATFLTVFGYIVSYVAFPVAMTALGVPNGMTLSGETALGVTVLCITFALAAIAFLVWMSIASGSMKEAQLRLSLVSALPVFLGVVTSVMNSEVLVAHMTIVPILNTLVALKDVFALTDYPGEVWGTAAVNVALGITGLLLAWRRLEREDLLSR